MKSLYLIILTIAMISACDQKPKNPVAEYGNAMIDSYKRGQTAADAENLDALRKAVSLYRITHDAYPQSLSDLDALKGSPIDMSRYDYNPQTGIVSYKK